MQQIDIKFVDTFTLFMKWRYLLPHYMWNHSFTTIDLPSILYRCSNLLVLLNLFDEHLQYNRIKNMGRALMNIFSGRPVISEHQSKVNNSRPTRRFEGLTYIILNGTIWICGWIILTDKQGSIYSIMALP